MSMGLSIGPEAPAATGWGERIGGASAKETAFFFRGPEARFLVVVLVVVAARAAERGAPTTDDGPATAAGGTDPTTEDSPFDSFLTLLEAGSSKPPFSGRLTERLERLRVGRPVSPTAARALPASSRASNSSWALSLRGASIVAVVS